MRGNFRISVYPSIRILNCHSFRLNWWGVCARAQRPYCRAALVMVHATDVGAIIDVRRPFRLSICALDSCVLRMASITCIDSWSSVRREVSCQSRMELMA